MPKTDIKSVFPISANELLDKILTEEPAYIKPCILPKGGKLLFGGLSKIGKSWCAIELARGLISGTSPFACDKITVPEPVRVLYLEAEIGEIGLQSRLRKAISDLEPEVRERLSLIAKLRVVRFDQPDTEKHVAQFVKDTGSKVLIIDPISKFHSFSENDNSAVDALFSKLDKIQSECGDELSLIISHHFGKPSRKPEDDYDALSPHSFRGASKFSSDPDTLAMFARDFDVDVPPNGWRLRSRWITRQGISPFGEQDIDLNVMEGENGRVLYKAPIKVTSKLQL